MTMVIVLVGLKMAWPALATIENGKAATDVLGQTTGGLIPSDALPNFTAANINNAPNGSNTTTPWGTAIDRDHNLLFVADEVNNRVLAFPYDGTTVGLTASYVLGQVDFSHRNFATTDSGMYYPLALAYDIAHQRLFVADGGNNRVLVFDFLNDGLHNGMAARYELGQENFITSNFWNNSFSMSPGGLAYDATLHHERLFVADSNCGRVMVFDLADGIISNGMNAVHELGQPYIDGSTELNTCSRHQYDPVDASIMRGPAGLAYDATPGSERLFVADSGIGRILVFNLATGITNGMNAVHELGAPSLNYQGSFWDSDMAVMQGVSGLAYDAAGSRLYATEGYRSRVLAFDVSTIVDGTPADFALGQADLNGADSNRGGSVAANTMSYPNGVTWDAVDSRLFVADTSNGRVLSFASGSLSMGHAADGEAGQVDNDVPNTLTAIFTKGSDGLSSRVGMTNPAGAVFDTRNHRLFTIDQSNNRVLEYDLNPANNQLIDRVPDHVLGTATFDYTPPATTEPSGFHLPTGLAYDTVHDRLFIADGGNARVLVFDAGPATLADGMAATYALGQPSLTDNTPAVSQSGLSLPTYLAYDPIHDRLFVSNQSYDNTTGLGSSDDSVRVFDFTLAPIATGMNASYLLGTGSGDFDTPHYNLSSASASEVGTPNGLAYDATPGSERLFVADKEFSRVLVFNLPNGDITSGMAASHVLGQSDFSTLNCYHGVAIGGTGMCSPGGLAFDAASNRLFVADVGGSRVLVFATASIVDGQTAVNVIGQPDMVSQVSELNLLGTVSAAGLSSPKGLAFDATSGQLIVADTIANRVMLYDSLAPDASAMHPPTAVDDPSYETYYGNTLTIADPGLGVLANDTDQDGRTMSVRVEPGLGHDVQHGTLHLNWDGTFDYTPTPGYYGTDSFTYEVNDGLLTATATVTITVPQAHAPTAVNESYTVVSGQVLTVDEAGGVLHNDSDQDGRTMTVTVQTDVQHGMLSLDSTGAFTYTPSGGYSGVDSFTYLIDDGLLTASATATITVYENGVEQVHYLWREDNGNEVNASPAAVGEDHALTNVAKNDVQRLRFGVRSDASGVLKSRNQWTTAGMPSFVALNPAGAYPAGSFAYYLSSLPGGSIELSKTAAKDVTVGSTPYVAGAEIYSAFIGSDATPWGMTLDTAGNYAYVSMDRPGVGNNYIARVDLAAGTVGAVPVAEFSTDEGEPVDMRVIGDDLYIGTYKDSVDRVQLIKISSLSDFDGTSTMGYQKTHVGSNVYNPKLLTDGTRLYVAADGVDTSKLYSVDLVNTVFSPGTEPNLTVTEAATTQAANNPCPSSGDNGSAVAAMVMSPDHTKIYLGCRGDTYSSYGNGKMYIYQDDISQTPVVGDATDYFWNEVGPAGMDADGYPLFVASGVSGGSPTWRFKLVRVDKETGVPLTEMALSTDTWVPQLAVDAASGLAYVTIGGDYAPRQYIEQVELQSTVSYSLEYAPNPSSDCSVANAWTPVPASSGTPSADWQVSASAYSATDVQTTHNTDLVDPGAVGYTFTHGFWLNAATVTEPISVGLKQYTEVEFSLAATDNATDGGAYCFRLTNNGATFVNYPIYAEATVGSGSSDGLTNVSYSPSVPTPTTDTLLTFSATAVDADGVSSISLFLDGSGPQHRVMTCSYVTAGPTETCSLPYGALLSGDHTLYARYTDGLANVSATSSGTFITVLQGVPGATTKTTVNRVILGRLKAGETTTAKVEFNLNETLSGKLTVTFPAGFTINSLPTLMSTCLTDATIAGQTVTAIKDNCSGPISLEGIGVSLPSTVGTYHFSWINDSPGWADVVIVADDQVHVNTQVDPSLSFDVTAQNDCSAGWAVGSLAFTAHSYVVNLGHLNSVNGYKAASNGSAVPYICTLLNTNATNGAVVSVKSANAGLKAGNGDAIASVTGAADGTNATPNYGVFVGAKGQNDVILPAAGHAASLLAQTGASEVFGVTAGGADVWNTSDDATAAAWHTVGVAVAATATTPAHQDYADTLTFVATATF